MGFSTLSLLTIFLFLPILTDYVITATNIREKCECINVTNNVRWRAVKGFEVKEPEALCNKVQIIMRVGKKLSCLNPESNQGKRLLKCWKGIGFNEKKKKACFTPKKSKTKKKTKKKRQ
ncbi:chemokine (C-X-C motif) ligand 18a, duplicate 1 [Astyanax mexicanus]|uniref:chemokine (C-X-C motif) ligand 18a, duplicate 1 n=1 Tax=Astyanax mexicanus TaxID=7994 RepID=UPI000440E657|nr:chemokine (C-X-C motif) ligand 18a, duplicate 1 [Astyanax mexicanus]